MTSSESTVLHLPQDLPFPIKVVSIDASASSDVMRGTRLLSYSFIVISHTSPPETRFGTWDSPIEGSIQKWNIKPGDVVSQKRAKEKPVISILEPCKHGMQLGGLCVLCGKDMTNVDYTGYSDASRASIQMTHSAFGPTVSLEEAQRIEKENAEHLLKSRKLSLIVDLDQTIVHATVDPTVGEWITEGEAWEARQSSSSQAEPDSPVDDCNPNWEALKDVKKFRLGPDTFNPPGGKGKARSIGSDGCMYYIKPRPGWDTFLRDMATKYEMHVYTMGTRAYAEQVCAAIDPDNRVFGGRLLSRDESGSLTQKSLQRLFPCDTSMVVIIDDRSDVWEWSPNLIKVIPYDFFIGIGDINSTFLPKVEPLAPSLPSDTKEKTNDSTDSTAEELERAENQTKAMLTENSLALEAQVEERPLAKRQEALEENDPSPSVEGPVQAKDDQHHHRKALLKNDDVELERVRNLLDDVHTKFFAAYDDRSSEKRRHSVSGKRARPPSDVTLIIPAIRSQVLQGVHIVFSSVIPLDTPPETTEVWKLAHMFGAKVSTELSNDVTHVVAAKPGTVKVDMARRRGGVKIVYLAWFTDSIAKWSRQDEKPYFLDEPPQANPSTSPTVPLNQITPDIDESLEEDNWGGGGNGLELDDINWDDINDEVEAAMNESDDDDDGKSSGLRSGYGSDEDMGEDSAPSTPNRRKRLRSLTPSELGMNGNDGLRSPLSKRKKIAADRSGTSKLKETINAEPSDNDEGKEEDESEVDDDFLARELEEELG